MKIYLIHSSTYDYQNELYKPIKGSSLIKKHEFVFLYDETEMPGSTKEIIRNVDLVIAEVSFPATGIGIELGWADAFGKKIICIYKSGEKISRFLNVLTETIVAYENQTDLIKKLGDQLNFE